MGRTQADINRIFALESEILQLRTRLLTAAGDDLCRLTQEEIKAFTNGEVQPPPKEEFLHSCSVFHDQIAGRIGTLPGCLTIAQLIAENEKLRGERDKLSAENTEIVKISNDFAAKADKLQKFKDWTHNRLDRMGVPHHPPGPHGAAGCRIGDRMDWLEEVLRGDSKPPSA